jgi:quercetin dioxygenase-like cupin family protein
MVKSWDLSDLELKPRLPEILSSSEDARTIALDLAAGESLDEHEVHERAFLVVLAGEVEVGTGAGAATSGGPGLLIEFEPRERHMVTAKSDTRLLLLLTPWPGDGHPGAMELREKLYTRRHAAKRAE